MEGDPRPDSHAPGAIQELMKARAELTDPSDIGAGGWQCQQSQVLPL